MSNAQQRAFTEFIRAGNGFLGVHSATDTLYQWDRSGGPLQRGSESP
jgi:hypothetical protein